MLTMGFFKDDAGGGMGAGAGDISSYYIFFEGKYCLLCLDKLPSTQPSV